MALTRKLLKAMGIEDEKIQEIIDAHVETVEALKAERDANKNAAEELATVQKDLETAKKQLAEKDTDGSQAEYDKLKKEYDDYKAEVAAKETNAAKAAAYRALLAETGLKGDKLLDTIMKGVDLSKVELDGEKIKGAEELTKSIKTDWADYIGTVTDQGANVATPPANTGGADLSKMTDAEYFAYQRQQKQKG